MKNMQLWKWFEAFKNDKNYAARAGMALKNELFKWMETLWIIFNNKIGGYERYIK